MKINNNNNKNPIETLQGEAQVIRKLKTGMWDPEERKKKIVKQNEDNDKYHQTMKRIDFIASSNSGRLLFKQED